MRRLKVKILTKPITYFYCKRWVKQHFTAPSVQLSSKTIKSKWVALASSVYLNRFPAGWAIDSNTGTIWASNEKPKQWLTVKMNAEHWVKGVKLLVRTHLPYRMKHLEVGAWVLYQVPTVYAISDKPYFVDNTLQVKVGNVDVPSDSPLGQFLCQNQLCFMTGNEEAVGNMTTVLLLTNS